MKILIFKFFRGKAVDWKMLFKAFQCYNENDCFGNIVYKLVNSSGLSMY